MPGGDTDKTEKATGKRRDDARKKGQVAVSQDLNRALKLMVCLIVFHLAGFQLYMGLSTALREYLGNGLTLEVTDPSAVETIKNVILNSIELLLPFLISILVVMLAANFAQVGFKITTETITLNLGKLDPIKGAKKIFSLRSVIKLFWSVMKVLVLALVVYWSLNGRMLEIGELSDQSLPGVLRYCFSLLFLILFRIGLVLIIMGVLDYLYQWWQHEQDLKMSKDEVKEEMKQTIGDPLIKRRIRQAQFNMFKQRITESVPEATVVVTNPTTYAVAVKYERGEMNAPVVVAKGMNLIAETIKTIGRKHSVPIVENRMLAQSLYRTVEIGSEVPARLYQAMAEILTYVYKLKGKA